MIGRLTIFSSESPLAKRYSLGADGSLSKTTAAQMMRGTYDVAGFGSVGELAELVERIGTSEALCASLPLNGSASGEVVTQAMLADHAGAVARTKRHFGLPAAPGLLFVDCDQEGITREALWDMLCKAAPGLDSAGVLWRPSGSSHICHDDRDLTGLRGQHLYVMIADAGDGPRVVKTLAARLWLAGHGSVLVSKAGSLLLRCPIDTAPADAARLIFAGGAIVQPPLEQRRGPAVILSDGGFLDSRSAVPDLTAEEEARLAGIVENAKAEKMAEAMQRRAEYRAGIIADRVPALMRESVSAADAEQRVGAAIDAAFGGTLLADFALVIVGDNGRHEKVTVAQVLADRLRYDCADCLDPINPGHRGGAADARLYLLGTSPILFSLDDGGTVYRLRSARQRLSVGKGTRHELVQQLASIVAANDGVFRSDVGPVLVGFDGRQSPLTVDSLTLLIGGDVDLVTHIKNGTAPTDLQRDTAQLVLAALRA